jgi:hypothetical protein
MDSLIAARPVSTGPRRGWTMGAYRSTQGSSDSCSRGRASGAKHLGTAAVAWDRAGLKAGCLGPISTFAARASRGRRPWAVTSEADG